MAPCSEGVDDFFRGLYLDSVIVRLVKNLAELLGCVHRNDPFAVFVTIRDHLDSPQSRDCGLRDFTFLAPSLPRLARNRGRPDFSLRDAPLWET